MEKKTPGKELKKSVKPSDMKKKATATPSIPPAKPAQTSIVKEKPASVAAATAAAKQPVKSTVKPSQKTKGKTTAVKKATKSIAKTAKTAKK